MSSSWRKCCRRAMWKYCSSHRRPWQKLWQNVVHPASWGLPPYKEKDKGRVWLCSAVSRNIPELTAFTRARPHRFTHWCADELQTGTSYFHVWYWKHEAEDSDLLRFLWWPQGNLKRDERSQNDSSPIWRYFVTKLCQLRTQEMCWEQSCMLQPRSYKHCTTEFLCWWLLAANRKWVASSCFGRCLNWSESPIAWPCLLLCLRPGGLTPNHLLLLKAKLLLPPGERNDIYSRRRWHQVQYLADLFWKRWTREYLPSLQERQKWSRPERNISVSAPRNSWIMGPVIQEDSKGRVRQVQVKTSINVLLRPVTKHCLLF